MTIAEIKSAVDAGLKVHCLNSMYYVTKDNIGQYLIKRKMTSFCIGLTNEDGTELNGKEEEFYVES